MRIALFGNKYKTAYIEQVDDILNALKSKNAEIVAEKDFFNFLKLSGHDISCISDSFTTADNFQADFAFSIGGDGTFLTTASVIGDKNIPILGINTGHLGFMTDVLKSEVGEAIEELFAGEYVIEERTVLKLTTDNPDLQKPLYALNEIAVLKQDSASMIGISASVNGEYLNHYQADGLIVATPTGSTAYSMSVGGPIVVPQAHNLILSPVSPHSLNVRPLVIPDNWTIDLEVKSRSKNFLVSSDGRSSVFSNKYKLKLQKGEFTIKIIKRKNHTFFTALREKLLWGIDNR